MNRVSAARRRADQAYRDNTEEYRRLYRNATNGSVPRPKSVEDTGLGISLDSVKVLAYIDQFLSRTDLCTTIHGTVVTERDQKLFRNIRSGKQSTITLERVDELTTQYDLQLWEIEEIGQIEEVHGSIHDG
jgi:hypothetical protein